MRLSASLLLVAAAAATSLAQAASARAQTPPSAGTPTSAASPASTGGPTPVPSVSRASVPSASETAPQPLANGSRFGFLTTAQLADQCNGQSPYALTHCYAYLAGLYDTMRAYEVWLTHSEFCAPARVTLEDLRRVFLAFVEANPGYREGQGASVGAVALRGAYPCGTANP